MASYPRYGGMMLLSTHLGCCVNVVHRRVIQLPIHLLGPATQPEKADIHTDAEGKSAAELREHGCGTVCGTRRGPALNVGWLIGMGLGIGSGLGLGIVHSVC